MAAKERKSVLLRLDPEVHEALSRWAADELRSANAQIEFLLRRALARAGRLPKGIRADALPRRGRPTKHADEADDATDSGDTADTADTADPGDPTGTTPPDAEHPRGDSDEETP